MVRLLLEAGANHGVSDDDGLTALHHVFAGTGRSHPSTRHGCCSMLVLTRREPTMMGRTASDYAVESTQLQSILGSRRRRLTTDRLLQKV